MFGTSVGALVGALLAGPLALAWLIGLLLYGTLPIVAVVALFALRGIRRELDRLNNTLESHGAPARGGPFGV